MQQIGMYPGEERCMGDYIIMFCIEGVGLSISAGTDFTARRFGCRIGVTRLVILGSTIVVSSSVLYIGLGWEARLEASIYIVGMPSGCMNSKSFHSLSLLSCVPSLSSSPVHSSYIVSARPLGKSSGQALQKKTRI